MATISYISFISLTYCVFILSIYQINRSVAFNVYQYKNHPFHDQQQDNGRFASLNEYLRRSYPLSQQQLESPYYPSAVADNREISNTNGEINPRINWFKREVRVNNQGNKRMLCFFHAVNCFG